MAIGFFAGLYGFSSRLRMTKRNSKRITRFAMLSVYLDLQVVKNQLFTNVAISYLPTICDKYPSKAHF